MGRVYLDACVAIDYIEQHPVFYPPIRAALFSAEGESAVPVFSDLTRLECRLAPLRQGDTALLARYDALFSLPDCGYAPLDSATFDLATELRAREGIKTPDALYLAAALQSGCGEFWTRDFRLAKAGADRIGMVVFDATQ